MPYVSLLKLSDEEVDFLGTDALSQVPIAVVTRGDKGLSLYGKDLRIDVPRVDIEVTDTIGAGDTIMGALLAQVDQMGLGAKDLTGVTKQQWSSMLHFAATAAAITVSRKGAQPPTRTEVEELL